MSNNENQEQKIEESIIEQVPEQAKPKKIYVKKGLDERGRKPTPDKETAYGLPTDPEYFKKYYHTKLAVKTQCPECLLFVCKVNLKKHKESVYHKRFCQVIEDNKKTIIDV